MAMLVAGIHTGEFHARQNPVPVRRGGNFSISSAGPALFVVLRLRNVSLLLGSIVTGTLR